jgi:hypothetical protein
LRHVVNGKPRVTPAQDRRKRPRGKLAWLPRLPAAADQHEDSEAVGMLGPDHVQVLRSLSALSIWNTIGALDGRTQENAACARQSHHQHQQNEMAREAGEATRNSHESPNDHSVSPTGMSMSTVQLCPNGAMAFSPGLSEAIPWEQESKTSSTPTGLWQTVTRPRAQSRWG